jgi:transcriptional antiterminator RfaH
MRWYVLKTKPRAEHQVASYLASRQVDVYCPVLRRRGRTAARIRPLEVLFPGYLFCRLGDNPEHWKLARWSPGTAYILGDGEHPIPVPDPVIEAIRARVAFENQVGPAVRFQPGDRVRILSGPLAGLEAVFDRALSPSGRSRVLVAFLSSLTRVELDARVLQKLPTKTA